MFIEFVVSIVLKGFNTTNSRNSIDNFVLYNAIDRVRLEFILAKFCLKPSRHYVSKKIRNAE